MLSADGVDEIAPFHSADFESAFCEQFFRASLLGAPFFILAPLVGNKNVRVYIMDLQRLFEFYRMRKRGSAPFRRP